MTRRRGRVYLDKVLNRIGVPLRNDTDEVEEESDRHRNNVGVSNLQDNDDSEADRYSGNYTAQQNDVFDNDYDIDEYYPDNFNEREDAISKVASSLAKMNISEKCMKEVFEMAKLISKYNINLGDVKRCNSRFLEEFAAPKTLRYCSKCHGQLNNVNSVCETPECPLIGIRSVRGSISEQTVLTTYSVRQQLKKILNRQIGMLIETHSKHHSIRRSRLEHTDLSSFHLSRKYSENIESEMQFASKLLKIPVSISYDGVCPTNASKSEITPLYVRIEGVPKEVKERESSIILAAIHSGPGGVTDKNADIFANRFVNEVEELKFRPLIISFGQEKWSVYMEVVMSLTDMKASRSVSGFPSWNASDGCSDCDVIGCSLGRSGKSFFSRNESRPRTIETVKSMMKQNSLTTLVPPFLQPIDELHVISEGFIKRIFMDMSGKSSFWSEAKLSPTVMKSLDQMLVKIRSNPQNRSQFTMFSKMGKLTGSQIKQTSRVIFTVLAVSSVYEDVYWRVFLLFAIRYIDLAVSVDHVEQLDELSEISSFLKSYVGSRHHSTYTMKTHVLLDHLVERIRYHGNLSGTSTANFEKNHRLLTVNYDQYSTNTSHLGDRFLLKLALNQQTSDGRRTLSEPLSGMDYKIRVQDNFKLKDQSQIDEFSRVIPVNLQSEVIFWKRLHYCDKLMSSNCWVRGGKITNSNAVSFRIGEETHYGVALVFFTSQETAFLIVKKMLCRNPIEIIYEEAYAKNMDFNFLDMLWNLRSGNDWIQEVIGEEEMLIVPVTDVIKQFISIDFRGKRVILESHN